MAKLAVLWLVGLLLLDLATADLAHSIREHVWAQQLVGTYNRVAKTDNAPNCSNSVGMYYIEDVPLDPEDDDAFERAVVEHTDMSMDGLRCTSDGALILTKRTDTRGAVVVDAEDTSDRICEYVRVVGVMAMYFDVRSSESLYVLSGRLVNGSLPRYTPGEIYMALTDSGAGQPWGCWYLLNASQRVRPSPSSGPDVTPSSPDTEHRRSCFPGDASVMLENKTHVRMDSLQIGDRVYVGQGMFSEIFMFTHKSRLVYSRFRVVETESGHEIALTKNHYIYVEGMKLAAASILKAGDKLILGDGQTSRIVSVRTELRSGLFNPQTLHGDIVVDGIRASTYTTAIAPSTAHAVLAAFRLLYRLLHVDASGNAFASGILVETLGRILPHEDIM